MNVSVATTYLSALIVGVVFLLSGKPAWTNIGTILVATSTSAAMAAEGKKEIQKLNSELEAMSAGFEKKITAIKQEASHAVRTADKAANQAKKLNTSQCQLVGKLQKGQHEHHKIIAMLNHQKQEVENLKIKIQTTPKKEDKKIISLPHRPSKKTVTHIYIDGNNLEKTAQELGLKIDWKAFKVKLAALAQKTNIFTLKYYTGLPERPLTSQKRMLNRLENLGYEVLGFPLSQRGEGQWKTVGDDMAMGLDLIEAVQPEDMVILVTGDGDFIPLIEKLHARKIEVNTKSL